MDALTAERKAAHNSGLAKVAGSCLVDSLVVAENFVLRIKFSGKIPPIANLQNVTGNPMTTLLKLN